MYLETLITENSGYSEANLTETSIQEFNVFHFSLSSFDIWQKIVHGTNTSYYEPNAYYKTEKQEGCYSNSLATLWHHLIAVEQWAVKYKRGVY